MSSVRDDLNRIERVIAIELRQLGMRGSGRTWRLTQEGGGHTVVVNLQTRAGEGERLFTFNIGTSSDHQSADISRNLSIWDCPLQFRSGFFLTGLPPADYWCGRSTKELISSNLRDISERYWRMWLGRLCSGLALLRVRSMSYVDSYSPAACQPWRSHFSARLRFAKVGQNSSMQ